MQCARRGLLASCNGAEWPATFRTRSGVDVGPKRPFWPSSPVVARFWGKPEGRSRVYQPTHHLYKMVGTLANTRPCPQRHQPPCSAHVHAPSHAHAQTPLGPTAPVAGLLCGLAVRLHCLSHCLSHTCRIYYVAPLPPTPQACPTKTVTNAQTRTSSPYHQAHARYVCLQADAPSILSTSLSACCSDL